jgi:large subunit ribosomal protein L24
VTTWSSPRQGQGQARHRARCVDAERLLVEGINRVKKHTKPNPMKGTRAALSRRKCRSISPTWRCSIRPPRRADRVGFKLLDDGRKVRVFKSNGEVVDA